MSPLSLTLLPLALVVAIIPSSKGFTLDYVNNCGYDILAAVAQAPNGDPEPAGSWGGNVAANGGTNSHAISDSAVSGGQQ